MSHRIKYRSEIKDPELAVQALTASKMAYEQSGNIIRITSGALARATIDLSTGEVESDSDYHSKEDLGSLRQAYSEAEVRRVMQRQGAQVESRRVLDNGDVKILCRMHG